MSNPLHLPDLTIKGFRGIDRLTIPRLGRVTLLAGKNGVGKTTVLEAVRVFASRGGFFALSHVLEDRHEVELQADDEHNLWVGEIDFTLLFYRGDRGKNTGIYIGTASEPMYIDIVSVEDEFPTLLGMADSVGGVSVRFRNKRKIDWTFSGITHRSVHQQDPLPKNDELDPGVRCGHLGPESLSEEKIARYWNNVVLTDDEDWAVKMLRPLIADDILGVAVIGDTDPGSQRMVVRLKEQDRPVPLKSLGDGAVRLFGVALALANSRGGFLLIDEAENGIHHTVQYDLWKMILRTAHANDVQVLATTHSWDCVRGFAYAAAESEESNAVLIRLDRDDRGLRAVEYSEEDLKIAADQGIEVR